MGLVVEAILFICVLTYGISPSTYACIQVAVQACRMLVLVLLSTVLLSTVLFTKSSKTIGADEESASLLGHDKGESDDTQALVGISSYGTITIAANGEAADLEYEAEQRKKDQERKERLEKRLQAEGNWFTYDSPPEVPLCPVWHTQAYWAIPGRWLIAMLFPPCASGIELIFR